MKVNLKVKERVLLQNGRTARLHATMQGRLHGVVHKQRLSDFRMRGSGQRYLENILSFDA